MKRREENGFAIETTRLTILKKILKGISIPIMLLSSFLCVESTSAQIVSPWPMFGHDSQHTGRSPANGPQTNNLKWTFQAGDYCIGGNPVVAQDGTIYMGAASSSPLPDYGFTASFLAINKNGTLKWSYDIGHNGTAVEGTPAILSDGSVCFATSGGTLQNGKLYCLNSDGTLRWVIYNLYLQSVSAGLTVGKDDTIYLSDTIGERLVSIDSKGTIKWANFLGARTFSSAAIGYEGTIYVAQDDSMLFAFNPDGSTKWEKQLNTVTIAMQSPTIGGNGTIYLADYNKLFAINPGDGSAKWVLEAESPNEVFANSPAVGLDETIYIATSDPVEIGNLYAISPDGSVKWKYNTNGATSSVTAIGADGTIYYAASSSWNAGLGRMFALNPNGTLKWEYNFNAPPYSSPALSNDGTLYIELNCNSLYAFGPNLEVSGTIYNEGNHIPIPGVSVTLGSYSTTTNSSGYYSFEKISGGNYTLVVSKAGYFDYTATISLTTSTTRDVYLSARPGWSEKLWHLSDTGITQCYSNSQEIQCPSPGQPFYGQDAQYTSNPMSFTDSGSGTIIDNITGLIWQKEDDGQTRFQSEAAGYCSTMTLGGYDDWRLPTIKELQGIVDYGNSPINQRYFPNIKTWYWSSEARYADSNLYTCYLYSFGGTGCTLGVSLYTRCVHGTSITNSFTINGDGTVTDNVTGFVWQQADNGQQGTWEDALSYCQNLTLGGHTGWRLPNVKELVSIADFPSYYGTVDSHYFVTTFYSIPGYGSLPCGSWSSSSDGPSFAWGLGWMTDKSTQGSCVRCVRSDESDTCADGVLSGHVRNAMKGSSLNGVVVGLSNGLSTTTDSSGFYSFQMLSASSYTLSVTEPGYSPFNHPISICGNTTHDILLTKPDTVYGPKTNSGYGPDPVNTATGNYIFQRRDLSIPGRGLNFIFERNYNSQDASSPEAVEAPLGFGWTHTYNASLAVNPDSTVTIRWEDGKKETWTPDGSGGFTPQGGVFDTLTQNGDGTYTLKKKEQTSYAFSQTGLLIGIVDKNDNTISLTYTGNNLTQITDTVGRNIILTYDGNNRITQITDPIGRTIQYTYDGNGNLLTSKDMNDNITGYTYDTQHQILTVVDPRGSTIVTNVYDDQRRVVTSQRDAKGGQTQYIYDEVNSKTNIIDALQNTTIHFFDVYLRLIQETDPRGNSAFYTYDTAGNRTQVKDKNGNSTQYTYDAKGNVLTKIDALNNVTVITYDGNDNPLTRTDALENATIYEYDSNGNLTKTTDPSGNFTTVSYDTHGLSLTITDPRGKTTTNTYDAEGNLTQVEDALGNKTIYTYDGVGRKLTVKDTLNHTTTYTYDNNNNLLTVTDPSNHLTTYTYDPNNNKLTVIDPRGNTTSYAYDVKDLLTTTTDALNKNLTNSYDALDRKAFVTDKRGNRTSYSYDSVGNLIQLTTPDSQVTTYSYDPNGNKITETNPLGKTLTYTYDAMNRVATVADPLGNTTTSAYDALGRVTSTTNAKEQTTGFEYDKLGRLTKVTDANGGTVVYTYDPNGNRLTMTDPNGNTTSYTYDDLNRLIQKVEPLGNMTQYAYDAVGNRIGLTDPNGNTINYTYDEMNRLSTITYPDASTVTFAYDENGNRTQMVDSFGTSVYAYDVLKRMTSYSNPFGKTVAYGYDESGNRTSLIYSDGKIVSYTYDALNRLTRVTDWVPNSTFYTYDEAGRLIEVLNPNSTKASYSYDDASRLISLSNLRSNSTVISGYSYTLDEIGNHLQVTQDEPLSPQLSSKNITSNYDNENRLTNAGSVALTYDANGNLKTRGGDAFTYDFQDRLKESTISGVPVQYVYDGSGNRLSRLDGSTTIRYILDVNGSLSNILAETNNNGVITAYYVYGLGLISKVLTDGTTYTYSYDSRGSTVAMTDYAQNITDAYGYNSFGTLTNSTGSTPNPFKYVGKYGVMDEANGLEYIRARYYIPEMGRFIAKDPLAGGSSDSQSFNRYVYALNNPIRLVDITGFFAQDNLYKFDVAGPSDHYHGMLIEPSSNMSNTGSTPAILTNTTSQTAGSQIPIPLSEEAFYSEMKKVLASEVLSKKPKIYDYMIDSVFWNDKLYNFEGKYVYGHELNYYVQGLLFKYQGIPEEAMDVMIVGWKTVNYPFSRAGIIDRPGATFLPSKNTFSFAHRGYVEYESLRLQVLSAGEGFGGGGGGTW